MWAGLLGLSYAFPEGVINKNLFKMAQDYEYQKPADMVLRLEKVCSMTFAYPVSLVLVFLTLTLYLGLLIGVYVWFDLNFFIIYVIFMVSVIGFMTLMFAKKKTKFKKWYSQSMLSSISAIYQSNIGKWLTIVYALMIFGISVPIIISDTQDFSTYSNDRGLIEKELEWSAKYLHYETEQDYNARYPRTFIPSEEISDDYLRLGIARYEGDGEIIEQLNTDFAKKLDSLGWKTLKETADLHRVYIDEQLVKIDSWSKHRLGSTKQKIYQTGIDVSNLEDGTHSLRVEKLLLKYGFVDNEPSLIILNQWDQFQFIKR